MEIWKIIKEFKNYEVSNFGNVKSRYFYKGTNERILKPSKNTKGYLFVVLYLNKKSKVKQIHQLVAENFLNHKPNGMGFVVNHKDFNKENNQIENLEIVTCRENTNRKHIKSSSEYVGVFWSKKNNKWCAQIKINNKSKHLGLFENEIEASNAYQNKLLTLNNT